MHGTTVATNALLERKGAKVGLLTTEGHRDVIEMREGLKDDRYNLRMPPPVPLVPRVRRLGVRERMRFDGTVAIALSARALEASIAALAKARVDAVAVCYLHSYRNPRHEKLTGRALARRLPKAYVSLSSEVLPQIKEYERVWTTVVNAYVGPALANYLKSLATRLASHGYRGDVLIIQSHGGVAPVRESTRLAAGAVLSGPAGGVAAGRYCARLLDEPNLDHLRHGRDVHRHRPAPGRRAAADRRKDDRRREGGAAGDRHPHARRRRRLRRAGGRGRDPSRRARERRRRAGPRVLRQGRLARDGDRREPRARVPRSGELPRRPHRRSTRAPRGRRSMRSRGALGTTSLRAAEGIARVVNTNMAEGIKIVSVRRGVDPRRFALVAFGGAAGLHVTEVARLLEIRRVVVPSVAAVLSAWGMLATDLRYELVRSHVSEVGRMTAAGLRKLFAALEREGRKRLARFDGPVTVRRALDMRYGEQIFEIQVDLDGVALEAADLMDQVAERFHRRHEELYAYSAPGQEIVIVNARVAVVGALPVLPAGTSAVGRSAAASSSRRRVWLGDWVEVPLYRMEALTAGLEVKGPAIFESATTTVLVRESERATVTPHGWLDIRLG